MFIYFNGKIVSSEECVVSPFDHGFLYGHGLFETMRSYKGRVFRLLDHMKRMEASAGYLGWPVLPEREVFFEAINSVLAANKLQDASVRLTVSRGIGAVRPDAASCGQPTLAVYASHLPKPLPAAGWILTTVSLRRNLSSPLVKIKSANYLDNMLARAEAKKRGAHEAIMLNTNGHVAEGSMSNIFIVSNGRLITPDDESGILPGITRNAVIQLAQAAGITVEVRKVNPEELAEADEIFLTSSVMEVIPVTVLDGRPVGHEPVPGETTLMLAHSYRKLAESE